MKTAIPILILLLGVGGFLCGTGYYRLHKSGESYSWKTADALVIKSEYKKRRSGSVTEIQYVFQADRKDYVGENVKLDGQDSASEDAKNFPVGRKLTAYYNPDNPSESVLIPGYGPWQTWVPMIAGAVVFLIPGLIMLGCLLFSLLPSRKK